MSENKTIGSLWVRTSKKDGKKFLTGKLGDMDIVCFENGFKKNDKSPDYVIYKSIPLNTELQKQNTSAEVKPTITEAAVKNVEVAPPTINDEDIPW